MTIYWSIGGFEIESEVKEHVYTWTNVCFPVGVVPVVWFSWDDNGHVREPVLHWDTPMAIRKV